MTNILRPVVKKIIPQSQRQWLRRKFFTRGIRNDTYEHLYEAYARHNQSEQVIGEGDFESIGRVELELLLMEGLRPTDTLADFGCGVGRLAVHVIPELRGGTYIGIDISDTMLKRANDLIRQEFPEPSCDLKWVKQTTPQFPLEDNSVDMMCAFSVFTHTEHEDTYRYLREALRVVRPRGRFIFSCTPLSSKIGTELFLNSADLDLEERWAFVRNMTTSVDYMADVVKLAGWSVLRLYDGETPNIGRPGGEMQALGQTSFVLEAPSQ